MNEKKQAPVIGIVGGVGPYAGLELNRRIFDNTVTDGTDQSHLEVLLFSAGARIPDRTEYLLGRETRNPAVGIFEALRALAAAGATVAAIACNTAHSPRILDQVRSKMEDEGLQLELVDMIGETGAALTGKFGRGAAVGVMASGGTMATGIYDRLQEDRCGAHRLVLPSPEIQTLVHRAIYDRGYGIKARSNPVTGKAKEECRQAALHLAAGGAEVVVLGCTELPLALPPGSIESPALVDPAEITARALIARAAPEKLRPLS
ncbi:MAG: aspartate/glutamate racemase family protein [Candidatus Glassbacteria bacterium]|nr:aspartate/glutamate racemase family protein [Candidatus Glassbacteria bacterium]